MSITRFALIPAVAATLLGAGAMSTSFAFHSASPVAVQAAAAGPATAASAASAPARPARQSPGQRAAARMTAWKKSGIERRNEAILVRARNDAWPHRNAELPAESALLAAAARKGLASPSPEDTAAWNKIMRDEIKIAKELPVVSEGDAATAEAPVIERDYFVFLLGSAAR
jgi:hypothetical protein